MAAKLSSGGGGRYEEDQNAEINVTPFVDVMLVLLIIFMVAAPLASVTVTPNPDTLAINGTQQFTAVGRDASGNERIPQCLTSAGCGLFRLWKRLMHQDLATLRSMRAAEARWLLLFF